MRFLFCLLYMAIAGIASHFIGNALPRRWFDANRFPYAAWKWEKGGKIYDKIHVHTWKDRVPDMSKIAPRMVRKSIRLTDGSAAVDRLVQETCVAEMVHLVLMLLSFIIYWICPDLRGAIAAVVYGLSHVPFIIIQRYNRPTLALLASRLKEREERKKKCTC